MNWRFSLATVICAVMALPVAGFSQTASHNILQEMGITQKLGQPVPLDVPFQDENGRTVTFGSLLGKRPVLLLPIFYSCQSGCPLITDSLAQTLMSAQHPTGLMGVLSRSQERRNLKLGKDLDVVMLSINPKETPALAADKKAEIMGALQDPAMVNHWHLLTGSLTNIRRITDAVGIKFYYNARTGVIRHPTCSVIIAPNATISAYTIGNEFPPDLLQQDLRIASLNQTAPKADQSFMFGCLMVDPATGQLTARIEGITRLAGILTVIILATSIIRMGLQERRANRGGHATGA